MMKLSLKKKQPNDQGTAGQLPQDFIGLESIKDGYAVHRSGTIICILEVTPVNVDLMTEEEKDRFATQLAQALNSQTQPFQIFSIGRSADLQQYKTQISEAMETADVKRRQVLKQLAVEAQKITISGDVMERHHYVILRHPPMPSAVQVLFERANILCSRLTSANMPTRVCSRQEIISLFMLFADPSSDSPLMSAEPEDIHFV